MTFINQMSGVTTAHEEEVKNMDFNKFRDRMTTYYKEMNKEASVRLEEPSDELKLAIMIGITVFMEMEMKEYQRGDGMRFGNLFDL